MANVIMARVNMEAITSLDNLKIKHVKKLLADKKYRSVASEYVAEGVRWIKDALDFDAAVFSGIFVAESKIEVFKSIIDLAFLRGVAVFTVQDSVFVKMSDTEHSQGLLAVLKIPFVQKSDGEFCSMGARVLYVDGVRDPGNLGTMIRTAIAFDFCDIILANCVDVYSPKVVRASMSAVLKAHLHMIQDNFYEDRCLSALKNSGYHFFVTDLGGQNVLTSPKNFDKLALVIGSEATGVSDKLKMQADTTLTIPLQNQIESLNAATAAGILMYELTK